MGRLVDYPADWGTPGADRMTGFGLPFKAVPAGSEGALIAELRASTEKKTPLLITFWQPHWAMSAYDVQFVELPNTLLGWAFADGSTVWIDQDAAGHGWKYEGRSTKYERRKHADGRHCVRC